MDEKQLGKGPSLIVAGEPDAEIENAIIHGLELRYKDILVNYTEKKKAEKGELKILKEDFVDLGEDYERLKPGIVVGIAYIEAICSHRRDRRYLKEHFKDINYREDDWVALPHARWKNSGQMFLEYELYEGRLGKKWNKYAAPVEGVARIWKRYVPIESEELAQLAKSYLETKDKAQRKAYDDRVEKLIKGWINGR